MFFSLEFLDGIICVILARQNACFFIVQCFLATMGPGPCWATVYTWNKKPAENTFALAPVFQTRDYHPYMVSSIFYTPFCGKPLATLVGNTNKYTMCPNNNFS